jgi:hypothetical protein
LKGVYAPGEFRGWRSGLLRFCRSAAALEKALLESQRLFGVAKILAIGTAWIRAIRRTREWARYRNLLGRCHVASELG